jgi:quercetin dioxygenase-like cupin family protein
MADELVPQGPRGISFEKPTLIPNAAAPRFLWGDERAGYVSDWIYGSSAKIHMMSFELNVVARFVYSPDFISYYFADVYYHCLKGQFTFHCPETGEVHVLERGDTLYFPPNTWHWGYNFGRETCHVLESLTPRTEEAVEAYAVKQPWLEDIRLGPQDLIGRFAPGNARGPERARLVRAGQYLYEIVGEKKPMRVGLVCSTEMLTTAIVDLYLGQESQLIDHPGDKVLYCLEGRMNVYLPGETPNWWQLEPGDSGFIPAGCRHAFFNASDAYAKFLFSVAPTYR